MVLKADNYKEQLSAYIWIWSHLYVVSYMYKIINMRISRRPISGLKAFVGTGGRHLYQK